MNPWTTPVTDRTTADIESRTQKAYIHAVDMNRIEGNIAYLSTVLHSLRSRIQPLPTMNWERNGVPTTHDIKRICDNINAIQDAYYTPRGSYDLSGLQDKQLDINDVNQIERNLLEIKSLLDRGIVYTTHGELRPYTHGQLRAYTHEQLQKGFGYPDYP